MLWMVGYVAFGFIAIVMTVIYGMVILPYICGYETEDWMDFFTKYLEDDQSIVEDCVGVVKTMFLWPLKIVWLVHDVIPDMINTYEARFKEE